MRVARQRAGKFQLNLNMTQRPIAKKYCEGKLKRTLKDELKVPEIVWRETKHGRGCGGVVYLRGRWKKEAGPEKKGWEMEVFHYTVTACSELPVRPEEKRGHNGALGQTVGGGARTRDCARFIRWPVGSNHQAIQASSSKPFTGFPLHVSSRLETRTKECTSGERAMV